MGPFSLSRHFILQFAIGWPMISGALALKQLTPLLPKLVSISRIWFDAEAEFYIV